MNNSQYAKSLGYGKKFHGKNRVIGRILLLRHSQKAQKDKPTASGLSPAGERMAKAVGRLLGTTNFLVFSSPLPRAIGTAELLAQAAGAKTKAIVCDDFSLDKWLVGKSKYDALVAGVNGKEELIIRDWINGKLPEDISLDPKKTVVAILKQLNKNYLETIKAGKELSLNVSHSDLIDAVFEALTGKPFDSLKPRTMVRQMEGLWFFFLKGGRIILRYRRKRFDVSGQLKAITG